MSFEKFKEKALSNPEVKEEYENLKPIYEIKKQLLQARLKKGLTQEEVARKKLTYTLHRLPFSRWLPTALFSQL